MTRFGALLARWEALLLVFLLAAFVLGWATSPYFLTASNISIAVAGAIPGAIIALAMTLVIVTGEIDISVGSITGLCAATMAICLKQHLPITSAIAAGFTVGTLAGVLNGVFVAYAGLPSLVVTIGTLALYRGIAYIMLEERGVSDFPDWYQNMGFGTIGPTPVPWSLLIFAPHAMGPRSVRRRQQPRGGTVLRHLRTQAYFGRVRDIRRDVLGRRGRAHRLSGERARRHGDRAGAAGHHRGGAGRRRHFRRQRHHAGRANRHSGTRVRAECARPRRHEARRAADRHRWSAGCDPRAVRRRRLHSPPAGGAAARRRNGRPARLMIGTARKRARAECVHVAASTAGRERYRGFSNDYEFRVQASEG
jgi:Branched-chain amino acid transport system / permease component